MKKTDGEISFSLSEKLIYKDLPSLENIIFHTEDTKNDQKQLTGFTIKCKNMTKDECMELANGNAQIISNLLMITTGIIFKCIMTGNRFKKSTDKYTVQKFVYGSTIIVNHVDLSMLKNNSLNLLEDKKSQLNRQIDYLRKAMNALQANDSVAVINNLHLLHGGKPNGQLAKYRSLRNALNHDPVYNKDIENIQKDFGLNYFQFISDKKFNYYDKKFDYYDEKNKKNLECEARKFLNQTYATIINLICNQTN